MKTAIQNPEYLYLSTDSNGTVCGCNQDWYPTLWQRRAGCGPTTASNLLIYHLRAGHLALPQEIEMTADGLRLMEEVWHFVTPTAMGVHTPGIFEHGLRNFFSQSALSLSTHSLRIPRRRHLRPSFAKTVDFIRTGLSLDSPVAFLNLANGTVRKLDPWHWVTITALDEQNEGAVELEICDNLNYFTMSLHEWYETTSRGGGFVYLTATLPQLDPTSAGDSEALEFEVDAGPVGSNLGHIG